MKAHENTGAVCGMCLWAIIIGMIYLASGCVSDQQRQDAALAHGGIEAGKQLVAVTWETPPTDAERQAVMDALDGAQGYVCATVQVTREEMSSMVPAGMVDAIRADAARYRAQAEEAIATAVAQRTWIERAKRWAMGIGGVLSALLLGRAMPGNPLATGLQKIPKVGPLLAAGARWLLDNRKDAIRRKEESDKPARSMDEAAARSLDRLLRVIAEEPDGVTVADLRRRVGHIVDPLLQRAVQHLLAHAPGERGDLDAQDIVSAETDALVRDGDKDMEHA